LTQCMYCKKEVPDAQWMMHLQKCPERNKQTPKKVTMQPVWPPRAPTLKELFKGSTLNGYVEAARTRTLTSFQDVDTFKPGEVLGLDFSEIEVQNRYQVNFFHKPSRILISILKKVPGGPHSQLPTPYRVWLMGGLDQMRFDVSSFAEAVERIRKVNLAKEFPKSFQKTA